MICTCTVYVYMYMYMYIDTVENLKQGYYKINVHTAYVHSNMYTYAQCVCLY